MKRTNSTRSIAALITQTPGTIGELRKSLRLGSESEAESLLRAWPVKEAFHSFANRCLSCRGPGPRPVPDWKAVDAYLHEKRLGAGDPDARRRGPGPGPGRKPEALLEERVAGECLRRPYDPLPHAAAFVLRVARFLDSEAGARFDVGPRKLVKRPGREFDRCVRATQLLGFLLKRHRDEAAAAAAAAAAAMGKGEGARESETDGDGGGGAHDTPTRSTGE